VLDLRSQLRMLATRDLPPEATDGVICSLNALLFRSGSARKPTLGDAGSGIVGAGLQSPVQSGPADEAGADISASTQCVVLKSDGAVPGSSSS